MRVLTRHRIGMGLAIACSVIGAAILFNFVSGAEERAKAEQQLVDVFVVAGTDPIPSGTAVSAMPLESRQLPKSALLDDVVTNRTEVADLVNLVDLLPGEQLVLARLGPSVVQAELDADDTVDEITTLLPDGYLEVTIPVPAVRALGGRITPGETVALVASFTGASDPPADAAPSLGLRPDTPLPGDTDQSDPGDLLAFSEDDAPADGVRPDASSFIMLHHVLVTAVQADAPNSDLALTAVLPAGDGTAAQRSADRFDPFAQQQSPSGSFLISFALSAPDVERVVYAAEYGSLWLARQSRDITPESTLVQRSDSVYWPRGTFTNRGGPAATSDVVAPDGDAE